MDGRKDERDQTALADLDRYIHITWRQFRPAAICAQPPRKLPRASLLLQVAKTRMELEGCEGQADSRQQWGSKGKGFLQHPFCFLSNHSAAACSAACLTGGARWPGTSLLLDRPLVFSICSEKQICYSQNSETARGMRIYGPTFQEKIRMRIYTRRGFSPCIFPAGHGRINLSEFKTLLAPGLASPLARARQR